MMSSKMIFDYTASNVGTTTQDNGIYLSYYCNNKTIAGNIVNDNTGSEIFLINGCDKNTISDNIAGNAGTLNQDYGIYLNSNCDFNNITTNYLSFNTLEAIRIATGNCGNNLIKRSRDSFVVKND